MPIGGIRISASEARLYAKMPRVVVEEEELVGQRREALLAAPAREVVRREVAGREARRDADGRADVEAERSRLLMR